MYTHTYIRTHTSEVFRFIVFASVFLLRMQNAVQKESETFDVCVAAVGSAAAALRCYEWDREREHVCVPLCVCAFVYVMHHKLLLLV